ncbi:MAG TPA: hypothetical protein VKT29_07890 [Terriglobales bacterium]|nr:hypothetical protein [Terriglobales bacterium]
MILAAAVPAPLTDWANFYVIVGSSAGALTGLQFVVIALIAQRQAAGSMLEIRAFGTLALLFIGIHNAWDTVTYVAIKPSHRPDSAPE